MSDITSGNCPRGRYTVGAGSRIARYLVSATTPTTVRHSPGLPARNVSVDPTAPFSTPSNRAACSLTIATAALPLRSVLSNVRPLSGLWPWSRNTRPQPREIEHRCRRACPSATKAPSQPAVAPVNGTTFTVATDVTSGSALIRGRSALVHRTTRSPVSNFRSGQTELDDRNMVHCQPGVDGVQGSEGSGRESCDEQDEHRQSHLKNHQRPLSERRISRRGHAPATLPSNVPSRANQTAGITPEPSAAAQPTRTARPSGTPWRRTSSSRGILAGARATRS